ncbi:izumo sperm-egg fusion protein 4 [Tenrec ecaudatus]|uniref:izumo sperm-egg fusion protein 4 n=1 Tax=Tenrec ecaudatus TaxID=94439 RepID=UPI003F592889
MALLLCLGLTAALASGCLHCHGNFSDKFSFYRHHVNLKSWWVGDIPVSGALLTDWSQDTMKELHLAIPAEISEGRAATQDRPYIPECRPPESWPQDLRASLPIKPGPRLQNPGRLSSPCSPDGLTLARPLDLTTPAPVILDPVPRITSPRQPPHLAPPQSFAPQFPTLEAPDLRTGGEGLPDTRLLAQGLPFRSPAQEKLEEVASTVYRRMDQLYQGRMYFPGYFPNELRAIFRDQVHLIQNAIIESRIDCQRHCGIFRYETISCNNCTNSHVVCFGYNCESSAQWEQAVQGLLGYISTWHK